MRQPADRHITQTVRLVAADLAAAYDAEIQRRLAHSVWTGRRTWYRNAARRIVTDWPGMAAEYRRRAARLRAADYGRSLK